MKKRISWMAIGLLAALSFSSLGFAEVSGLTLKEAELRAKAEPSYQITIMEDQIKQAKENLEEAMEESTKAAKKTYANDADWSGLSIQNQRAIYLIPLGQKAQLAALEQGLDDLKISGEDRLEARFYDLAQAQTNQRLADLQLELAKMNQAASKVRYEHGDISLLAYHDASYALLNEERNQLEAKLKLESAFEKFNQKLKDPIQVGDNLKVVWGVLPMMPRALSEEEIDHLALGTEAFHSAVRTYQKTVLEIRAIEEGFRGPKFEKNRPDSYPQALLDEIELAGNVADALVESKSAIKNQYANLQTLHLAVRQDMQNLKNREQEEAFISGKVENGLGSKKEMLEAEIGLLQAQLRYYQDRLAYETAVKDWNRDRMNWKETLAEEDDAWIQELNAYVATWKYDPEETMNKIGRAYTDWILSSHGISPSILESDEQ